MKTGDSIENAVPRLSATGLASLADRVATPAYDRRALTPGIVHIGVGNFHRAHQGIYMDDLFNLGKDHDWAITGAGVMPGDERTRKILERQDYLSTVVELDPSGISARIVGAMTDYAPVQAGNAALIETMARPETRIVSLTITEGGYYIDSSTNAFDTGHQSIVQDAANPSSPQTVFGAIISALALRRKAGLAPFTVMSCDNIPGNGAATLGAVTGLCEMFDSELAAWIAGNVAFPNSMVDRITPVTSGHEIALVRDTFHFDDPAPVTCEPFRQWVMEDKFTAGRPSLEDVEVIFTGDVNLYENMKLRILNGGHAIIAYPAALLDIEFAHRAMADPAISAYFIKVQEEEILPEVEPVPNMSPRAYLDLIDRRFRNPMVRDTTHRLCFDGSNRQPKFIVPSVFDNLQKSQSVSGLALVSALWCRYCEGVTESGRKIASNDPKWEQLTDVAARAHSDPKAWLCQEDIYGILVRQPQFVREFERWLRRIWSDGVRDTLSEYTRA